MRSEAIPRARTEAFLAPFETSLASVSTGVKKASVRALGIALPLILLSAAVNAESEQVRLVKVQDLHPEILVELKYATSENFMGEVLYPAGAPAVLRPEVAQRLRRVQEKLSEKGLGLKIFDAYRPLSVQKKMFARYPFPGFVANPKRGSNHNRAAAVDVTLVDRLQHELPMPSAYDEFSERSHIDYGDGTFEERKNRSVLQQAMIQEGFVPLETEWWHFNDPKAAQYAVLDIPFEELL